MAKFAVVTDNFCFIHPHCNITRECCRRCEALLERAKQLLIQLKQFSQSLVR